MNTILVAVFVESLFFRSRSLEDDERTNERIRAVSRDVSVACRISVSNRKSTFDFWDFADFADFADFGTLRTLRLCGLCDFLLTTRVPGRSDPGVLRFYDCTIVEKKVKSALFSPEEA